MIKRFLLLVCAWRWWCAGLLGLAVAFASGRLAGGYLFPRQISQDRPEEAAVDESSVCLSIPFGILSTQTQEDRDELRKICKQLLAPDFSWDAVLEEHKWLKGVPVAVFLLGQDIEGFGRRGDAVFLYVEIYEKPIDRTRYIINPLMAASFPDWRPYPYNFVMINIRTKVVRSLFPLELIHKEAREPHQEKRKSS